MQLPDLSLVDVELQVLAKRNPSWVSKELGHLVPPVIGCIPMEGEPASTYVPGDVIVAQAEMYGGSGVGANAGGVRCANIATCQIKGVGPTALAGKRSDKWHRHGACSLQDAVKETIFSRLFDLALPHGAARPIAIFDLGVAFATEVGAEKLPSTAPRALFVREPIVRLGHFMRSVFMNGAEQGVASRELPRMRAIVPMLVDFLCARGDKPSIESAANGLVTLYGKALEQVSALRLNRLVHGSLIPSNVGIDGKLVDFTTATAVSTFQPVVVALGGFCSQTQYRQVLDSVWDTIFYISKYDQRCRADRHEISRLAQDVYLTGISHYEALVARSHLLLIGMSEQQQSALTATCRDRLARAVARVIQQGSTDGHLYYGGDEHRMLPAEGRDNLAGVLLGTIARGISANKGAEAMILADASAFTESSVTELFDAYTKACSELRLVCLNPDAMSASHLIRATRFSLDLSELYRRNIDGAINELCVEGRNLSEFVEAVVGRWQNVFRYCPAGSISLTGWFSRDCHELSADDVLSSGGQPAKMQDLLGASLELAIVKQHPWLVSTFSSALAPH
jgi:hypothetical protein